MYPTCPLLIFLFSCLCLLTEERIAHGQQKQKNLELTTEEGKRSQTFKVKHRKKRWKIKTITNNGVDYLTSDLVGDGTKVVSGILKIPRSRCRIDRNLRKICKNEPTCSSDKHGSVGLAVDTTAWVFSSSNKFAPSHKIDFAQTHKYKFSRCDSRKKNFICSGWI